MFAGRNTSIDLDGTKNSPSRPQPIRETAGHRMSPFSARPRHPIPAVVPGLERHVDPHAPDSSRPAGNLVLPTPVSETPTATTRAREILFVDPRVSDIATLLSHLRP